MCGKIGSMAAAAAATAVSDRERYILSLRGSVLKTARRLCSRLPRGVQAGVFDDFIQAGWLGAIRAVDSHDPHKGVLDHYAAWRIKGAILSAAISKIREANGLESNPRTRATNG